MPGFFKTLLEPSAKAVVKKVRKQEASFRELSDEGLRAKTDEFRARIARGVDLFSLLPEAFACVVVAAERTVGMRHFDVQVQGGVELARSQIVEMKTGEGKTLVATLPAYLHGLVGKGVHIVTVNDYLARRDAEWMGPIYELLGLSVGAIQENMAPTREEERALRKAAYACDITYVTNSELVFDSLRDNLAYRADDIVQRGCFFAVVDEVDLLLVDEAQTPLIISGPGQDDATLVRQANAAVRGLEAGRDYKADYRSRAAYLTERGQRKVEKALDVGSLSDPANLPWAHATYQALQAHGIYERDVEYIIADGEIHIVDEHTGRVSPEKRYSNGLHQALEAKEGVRIKSEDLTLAKTSYQYFFRGYDGLSGMTGTAWTEREELRKTYQLKVVRVPTHKPMIREDYERVIYVTLAEKHAAVIEEIQEAREVGRPVLVGTVSVEESEVLSRQLRRLKTKHEVLNARSHEREAQIIAQAGRADAVTISTNMAGRGTDIMLGGSAKHLAREKGEPGSEAYESALERYEAICEEERETVVEAGGLLVIGTGEHESERIDNQLRGRAGRQGDPGASVFIVSIEDPVYRRFGEKRVLPALWDELADHPEGEPVDDEGVLAALEALRRKVEVENQAIRLDVFKYDSVVHDRRERVWGWRRSLLVPQDREGWLSSVHDLVDDLLSRLEEDAHRKLEEGLGEEERPPTPREMWQGILHQIMGWLRADEVEEIDVVERDHAVDLVMTRYEQRMGEKEHEAVIEWERLVLLDIIDFLWPQYLNDLERVEEGIWMRQYAQIDPFVEFRKEAAMMFGGLIRDIELNALRAWMSLQSVEVDEETAARLEKATSMLELEAGGQKNPDPIITSSRKSGSGALSRGIPAPGQRRKKRR